MSEDAAIRRENLRAIVKKRGWTAAEIPIRMSWGRYSYWRDLLADADKSFGEKVARRIEERLGLARGALDEPGYGKSGRYPKAHDAAAEPQADAQARSRAAVDVIGELFPRVSLDKLALLEPEILAKLEDGLLVAAGVLGLDIRSTAPQAASARTPRGKQDRRRA